MEELEAIKRRLAKVRREISSASEELQRLRAEEYGLMLSIARLTGQPLPRPVDEPPRAGRQAPRITPVIREILSRPSSLSRALTSLTACCRLGLRRRPMQ